jgi:hypothetical protein
MYTGHMILHLVYAMKPSIAHWRGVRYVRSFVLLFVSAQVAGSLKAFLTTDAHIDLGHRGRLRRPRWWVHMILKYRSGIVDFGSHFYA